MKRNFITLRRILSGPNEGIRFLWYWLGIVTILVLIPNIGLIVEVLFNQPTLSILGRLVIISSLYSSLFRFVYDPVTFSMLILSIVLALNFLVIRFVRRHNIKAKGRLQSALPLLVSSHCVACGGSLLAPVASLITGGSAYISNERYIKLQLFTFALNLIAIGVAAWSLRRAMQTAGYILNASAPR